LPHRARVANGPTYQRHRKAGANGTTYQLPDFVGWVASAAVQGALWRDWDRRSFGSGVRIRKLTYDLASRKLCAMNDCKMSGAKNLGSLAGIAMRTLILILFILATSIAGARSAPPTIDGAWVLSDKWTGFMGIALVIRSNEFRYWFYSDVPILPEPKYPVTGKVEFDGDVIRLRPNGDAHLYDTNWHLFVFQGEICLLADLHMRRYRDTQKVEDDRLLHKLDAFDEKKPVMNRPRRRD
jgi:hypothetical protein